MPSMPHWPPYLGPNKDTLCSKERTLAMLSNFNNPHEKLNNVIHITGTNGKGSTASYISSILHESGFKVGKYTSPHIHLCNERIVVGKDMINDLELYEIVDEIRIFCEKHAIIPTIFEVTTVAAFVYFAKNECEYNVIEVGMGGLFDATNIFDNNKPLVSIITPIDVDHTKFLGNKIEDIALHKSYIVKEGGVCISAPQPIEARMVIDKRCDEMNAQVYYYGDDFTGSYIDGKTTHWLFEWESQGIHEILPIPPLLGDHQIVNLSVAVAAMIFAAMR